MIRKLRLKFICVNMLIVTLMLTAIFGMVYHLTRQGLETQSEASSFLMSVVLPAPRKPETMSIFVMVSVLFKNFIPRLSYHEIIKMQRRHRKFTAPAAQKRIFAPLEPFSEPLRFRRHSSLQVSYPFRFPVDCHFYRSFLPHSPAISPESNSRQTRFGKAISALARSAS